MREKDISFRRGKKGENFACDFLRDIGYKIIHRNWRCRWGEIDIIAKDGETLVFVEVKTAKSDKFGSPLDWVDGRKQEHLTKSALQYLMDEVGEDVPVRFDVIAVHLNEMKCEHIKNAFDVQP